MVRSTSDKNDGLIIKHRRDPYAHQQYLLVDDYVANTGGYVTQADFDAHLADTTDAHDASAISLAAITGIVATDVQAGVAELAARGHMMFWGNDTIAAGADTRFLHPGFSDTTAGVTATRPRVMTRAGTLKNLYMNHNVAVGNGNSVVYTVMVNGVATGITVTLATGAVNAGTDTTNTAAVVAGDKVTLRAVKAAGIGNGAVFPTANLEFV